MNHLRVELDLKAANTLNDGPVFAGIALRMENVTFPGEGWTDFVVVVLSWWTQGALQLLRGTHDRVQMRFMDGPYLVEILSSESEIWHAAFIEARLSRRMKHEGAFEVDSFIRSLVEASEQVLALCQDRGWWSRDADELEASVAALRRLET